MEIRRMEKEPFAGKRFTARYLTNGYYDIRAAEDGFRIQHIPFRAAAERSFEDEFFGEWLDDPIAYGAFEDDKLLGFAEGRSSNGITASVSATFACLNPVRAAAVPAPR